jgi:hypothetical protein
MYRHVRVGAGGGGLVGGGGMRVASFVCTLSPFLALDNDNDFSLNNISNNPAFNFLNSVNNSDNVNDNLFFDNNSDDSPYSNLNVQCEYMDVNTCVNTLSNINNFSFLSLNVQSLHSKFTALDDLINNMQLNSFTPDVILLQEIWQIHSVNSLLLNQYKPLEF